MLYLLFQTTNNNTLDVKGTLTVISTKFVIDNASLFEMIFPTWQHVCTSSVYNSII